MNKDRELGVEEFMSSLINEIHKQEISHSCATREKKARSTTADKGFTKSVAVQNTLGGAGGFKLAITMQQ